MRSMLRRKRPCATREARALDGWPSATRLSVRSITVAGFLALVGGASAYSQAPVTGWDAPAGASAAAAPNSPLAVEDDDLLIGLQDWAQFKTLAAEVRRRQHQVLGALPQLALVRIRGGKAASARDSADIDFYRQLPYVRFVERNTLATSTVSAPSVPDDPLFAEQWHLQNTGQTGGSPGADISATMAWGITRGSSEIVVAVLDMGIVLDHPEFAGRLLPGWDFVDEDPDPSPTATFHGTYAAGLIAAVPDNQFEVVGVDHRCLVLPIKVGNLTGTLFDAVQGIVYAADQGASVISMSFVFLNEQQALVDALAYAAERNVVLVAGSGDSMLFGSADIYWPSASPLAISVGWTTDEDLRDPQSSTGVALDLVAPGRSLETVSKDASGLGKGFSGASASTPVVAGIVALMRSLNPLLSRDQVYDYLCGEADDQVGDPIEDTPGWDPYYGHGRANAYASLQALCGCEGGESLIASPQHASIAAGEVVALRIDAGREHAGRAYWVFGSASGAGAWHFGSLTLPITLDDYTRFTLSDANGAVLVNTHGLLDEAGQAMAFLMLPKGVPVPAPTTMTHVAVVFDGRAVPAHAVLATNVTTTLVEP